MRRRGCQKIKMFHGCHACYFNGCRACCARCLRVARSFLVGAVVTREDLCTAFKLVVRRAHARLKCQGFTPTSPLIEKSTELCMSKAHALCVAVTCTNLKPGLGSRNGDGTGGGRGCKS